MIRSLTIDEQTAFQQATRLLEGAQSVLVVTHENPDGDAIGSLLGVANMLDALGKQVTAAVDKGVPSFLKFLPQQERILGGLVHGTWDLLIFVDCGDDMRAGKVGEYGKAHAQTVLNIDHHPSNPRFGNVALVLDELASTAEIVFLWWQSMGLSYGREVALPLLTGIVTDTLGFRTSATQASTLEMAVQLMQCGASLPEVMARTLGSRTHAEFELWKRIAQTSVVQDGVGYAFVRKADAEAVGLPEVTDADFVQFLISVDEVRVAATFKERTDGKIGVSMRAVLGYNVVEIAQQFGGGGHVQAAGVSMEGTLESVSAQVLPLLQEAVSKGTLRFA
jgi:phosphoesterase RecJ-like protein